MKQKIEVVPLKGIFWEGKQVLLGDTREQAEAVLGAPDSVKKNFRYYLDSELLLDFDPEGRVEFIEFLSGIDGQLQPVICGVSAFEADADALAQLLARENAGGAEDRENGHCYLYLSCGVGIWRQRTPEDVRGLVRDADAAGRTLSAWEVEMELRAALHWATLGIGGKNYYGRNETV